MKYLECFVEFAEVVKCFSCTEEGFLWCFLVCTKSWIACVGESSVELFSFQICEGTIAFDGLGLTCGRWSCKGIRVAMLESVT